MRANLRIALSDLRNLVVAQEAYYADHGRYGETLPAIKYVPSDGSTIAFTVIEANSWSVRLTRPRLRGSCVIFVNLSADRRPRTDVDGTVPGEGEPRCDTQPEIGSARP